MRNLKNIIYKGLLCTLCLILMVSAGTLNILAAPMGMFPELEKQKVFLDHYQLTEDKIIPGSEFVLTLFLKNTGDKDAEQVIVDVMYSEGIMPAYGKVSQSVIDIPAGEMIEIELPYIALEEIEPPAVDFRVSIRENKLENATVLRTPVGSQSPFDVITTFVPVRAEAEENVNCSMTFKYLGQESADRIIAKMNVNGKTVTTAEIGKLPKETTKTQSLSAMFSEEGEYVVELYLDYRNESGRRQSILTGTSIIEIQPKNQLPANPGKTSAGKPQNSISSERYSLDDSQVLMASCGLIVIFFIIIIFLIKKKK